MLDFQHKFDCQSVNLISSFIFELQDVVHFLKTLLYEIFGEELEIDHNLRK